MNQERTKHTAILVMLLTLLFEAVTAFFRFGLDCEARDTKNTIGLLTGNIRIHHGYVGILLLLAAVAMNAAYPKIAKWLLPISSTLAQRRDSSLSRFVDPDRKPGVPSRLLDVVVAK